MRTLVYLFLFVFALSIECTGGKRPISVTKKSGAGGSLETFVITGVFGFETRTVATGVAVPAGANATQEFCLDVTANGEYSIELKQSNNGLWSAGSFITVKNVDNIIVYAGSLTSSTTTFTFTLSYLVNSGGSLHCFQSYDPNEWWQRSYTMGSDWVQVTSANPRTVEGVNLNRASFDLPNINKYSHVVIRLYHRVGVILFVNGVRYFYDNVVLNYADYGYAYTIMETEVTPLENYVWKDVIIPASLLYSTNNVLVIAHLYPEYDEYTELLTFSVMGVYASNPNSRCTPLPISISSVTGLKEGSSAEAMIDGDDSTQTVFNGAFMHITFETPTPAVVSDYTLRRVGDYAVTSWKLMSCGTYLEGTCSQWLISSNKQLSTKVNGTYPFFNNESTNLMSTSHRLQVFSPYGTEDDVAINEITLYTCGSTLDSTMYSYDTLTLNVGDAISLSPEYPTTVASYSIYPALPASAQFNPDTGVISGTTSAFSYFSTYTIFQNKNTDKYKFYLTVIVNGAPLEPVEPSGTPVEPTSTPVEPTEAPVEPTSTPVEPTEAPVKPTEAPEDSKVLVITIVIVVILVVVIIVVVSLACCNKKGKTLPPKPMPVVYTCLFENRKKDINNNPLRSSFLLQVLYTESHSRVWLYYLHYQSKELMEPESTTQCSHTLSNKSST